jgi:hypothetical protein
MEKLKFTWERGLSTWRVLLTHIALASSRNPKKSICGLHDMLRKDNVLLAYNPIDLQADEEGIEEESENPGGEGDRL